MKARNIFLLSGLIFIANTAFLPDNKKTEDDFKTKFYLADNLILDQNYPAALDILSALHDMDSSNYNIKWKIANCYLNIGGKKTEAIPYLEEAVQHISMDYQEASHLEKKVMVVALRDLAHAYHLDYQLESAINMYEQFRNYVHEEEIKAIDEQIKMCYNAQDYMKNPVNVRITNLGEKINSEGMEHSPVITADESTLMFTSRRKESTGGLLDYNGMYFEDIYVAHNDENGWTESAPVNSSYINTNGHEATIGLSVDGNTLFIYKDDEGDGSLYQSVLRGDAWSPPTLLGFELDKFGDYSASSDINSKAWETSAVLSADKNTMYFVSDREGGYGGRDIYKAIRLPNRKWSLAQNLGPEINTPYDEDAPFIHPDGIQLIFCSNRPESMGGFDVFTADLLEDGTWSTPKNVGYPINTTDDDISYITSVDGKRAYYASTRPGGFGDKDIYVIDLLAAAEKNLAVIKGRISDKMGKIFGPIVVTDKETNEVMGSYSPDVTTGKFVFILPQGKNYSISFQTEDQQYHFKELTIADNSAYSITSSTIDLTLANIADPEVPLH